MAKTRGFEEDISRVVADGATQGAKRAGMSFSELVRSDDPDAMRLAEDFLREKGWKLREVTGALYARNFTIELRPMWGPREEWKMVQTNVDTATRRPRGRGYATLGPGWVWVKISVANGPVRVTRERYFRSDLDAARKLAVANAWTIAKSIKGLPLDAPQGTIERIVDDHFQRRSVGPGLADIL